MSDDRHDADDAGAGDDGRGGDTGNGNGGGEETGGGESAGGWTRLGSEVVEENPWWVYRRDRVRLPSGALASYHYIRTPGSVMVIPRDAEGRFLCVRQYRYLNRRESLEFPGGGVPRGRSIEDAARGELREEAGVDAASLVEIGSFNPWNGVTDERCTVFLAEGLAGVEARQDETEDCRLETLSREDLEARIASGEIWDGQTLASWTLYLRRVLVLLACLLGMSPGARAQGDAAPAGIAQRPPVMTGADLLAGDSSQLVAGKRVALLCNHTAVLSDGTPLREALYLRGDVAIDAIFVPEHGLEGTLAAGETVAGSTWRGVPVYSLYGTRRAPTPEMLRGVDLLVADLQDVGVRCYTYVSTLLLTMEAAAGAGVPVLVLDRPNPLGGLRVEGPVMREALRGFTGMLPVPLRHGMTLGELARMAVGERWIARADRLSLAVLPMRGWRRSMHYGDTGLPWRNPSPNIVSDSAALLYAGVCLVEGTNVSEGRGTDAPFLQAGAPYVDAQRLLRALRSMRVPGVALRPARFVPRSCAAAPHPKLEGRECPGLRFTVTDRDAFRPVDFGVALLVALRETAGDSLRLLPALERLLGVPDPAALLAGRDAAARALRAWARESAAFAMKRTPYLLY